MMATLRLVAHGSNIAHMMSFRPGGHGTNVLACVLSISVLACGGASCTYVCTRLVGALQAARITLACLIHAVYLQGNRYMYFPAAIYSLYLY